jgi:hypothetical protein
MNRYAMVWTTNIGYMAGTNASLNAMEFYGFKGVDVYVLTAGEFLGKEYKDQWPEINFIDFFTFVPPLPPRVDEGWHFVSADIIKAVKLLRGYEVVLIWGGDLCILDNFTEYFEIAEKLGALVLGTNEHGNNYLRGLPTEWPYRHTWAVPYADIPFFVPRKWISVLELMLDYYYNRENPDGVDRMDGLNYAVRDLGARVHAVPGEFWVVNVPYRLKLIGAGNGSIYVDESSTRLKSFHRKYWSAATCREYLPGGAEPGISISRNNKMLFNRAFNFFNRECRVKWEAGLEVWDGT